MQSSFVGSVRPFQASSRSCAVAVSRSRTLAPVIENRVALRFQRFGRKKLPFYRLVAIDSKDRRDGRPLEYLGWVVAAGQKGLVV
jgi:small subunit ribosomal protein S16